MPRLHVDAPLTAGAQIVLPPGASRHAQVLRLQPGDALTLFDGRGGEWTAEVLRMGRHEVDVRIVEFIPIDRELAAQVTLAVGMPANDRMDDLVEKATELGVAAIQPLICERSVLRVSGERAAKKVQHWRGVAVAASEQSGRTRVPMVAEVMPIESWIRGLDAAPSARRLVLSLHEAALPLAGSSDASIVFLSGPEGGLAAAEEAMAIAAGFTRTSLGSRVLRADTAPLAALAIIGSVDIVNI